MNLENISIDTEEGEQFPLDEFVCTDKRQGELVYEYIRKDLPTGKLADVNEHLSECLYCREVVVMWEVALEALRAEMEKRKQGGDVDEGPEREEERGEASEPDAPTGVEENPGMDTVLGPGPGTGVQPDAGDE